MEITVLGKKVKVKQMDGFVRCSIVIEEGHQITADLDDESEIEAEVKFQVEKDLSNKKGWYAWEHGGEQHCQ